MADSLKLIQAAAVPIREGADGIEVLLVTSRYTGEWLLPKGTVEPGESPDEAAAREAREEAGVEGRVGAHLGSFPFRRADRPALMEAYILEDVEQLERWSEMFQRRRRWLSLDRALREVVRPVILEILGRAADTRG